MTHQAAVDASPPPREGGPPRISMTVAAFNEEALVREALGRLVASLEAVGVPFEIIVVDDGSSDGTAAVIDSLAAADSRVRALHHDRNLGLGAAIRTAVAASRGDYIVGSPVDSPLGPNQIRAFRDAMEGPPPCDVVVGYRPDRPGYRPWMRFGSRVYRLMLRWTLGVDLKDFNWISMYRRTVFDHVSIEFDRFIALPEILAKAGRAGLAFRQIPCPMQPRRSGKGTVGRPRVVWRASMDLLRLRIHLGLGRGKLRRR